MRFRLRGNLQLSELEHIVFKHIVVEVGFAFGIPFPHRFGGDAADKGVVVHVFGDHAARGDDGSRADGYAGEYGAVGVEFGVRTDFYRGVTADNVIGLGMGMGEYFTVFRRHGKVPETYSALGVEETPLVPGDVFAHFDVLSVIETAPFVRHEAVSAFFEKAFSDDLTERYGKRNVNPPDDPVHTFPKDMQIALFFGVGNFVGEGQAVRPQPNFRKIFFVETVYPEQREDLKGVFRIHTFLCEISDDFQHFFRFHKYPLAKLFPINYSTSRSEKQK